MDETTHDRESGGPADERGDAPEQRAPDESGGPRPGGAPQPWGRDSGRRRRGRRGRGGGRAPGGPFPAPHAPGEDDEGSQQAREIAAYERRQRQPQRGPWRGPGFRPQVAPSRAPGFSGPPRQPFAGPRPGGFGGRTGARPGGPRGGQHYQEMVRRATAGPRTGPPEEAGEPIAGPHAVLEAMRAGRVLRRIYVSADRGVRTGAVNDLIREAQEKHVQVRFVDPLEVQRLSPGVEHQGVVAIAEGRAGVDLEELLLHLDTLTEPPLVLVVDSLQDPQNYGVLLRSAEGAGAAGVVIPRHRQVGLTPAVARTSAGASEHLLIADVVNLRHAIDTLKERGIWVVGTDDSGDLEWDAVDYRGATAVVVGGEGEGIRRLVLEGCDQVVRIPMQGKVSSLNAAAAGTVVLFEALRQRIRDAAPPVVERRPPPPRAGQPLDAIDEQDELPEGDDVVPLSDEAAELIPEDATELARDDGMRVAAEDQDAPELAEAVADEQSEVDTDAMDALAAEPSVTGQDEKPAAKRATKRTTKSAAPKKRTARRTKSKPAE